MTRLSPHLIRRAHAIDPLLVPLVRTCRTIQSAKNELRWLREHAIELSQPFHHRPDVPCWHSALKKFCLRRGNGEPLQYILGNQPFGELDILCKPGVLIPRPETEAYTTHLAELLLKTPRLVTVQEPLRILDLCTGTGCIPLLLHSILSKDFQDLELLGIDLCPKAISLAKRNLQWNITQGHLLPSASIQIEFKEGDLFEGTSVGTIGQRPSWATQKWDVITSNPPYISPHAFNLDTSRSVRNWEPKLALIPPRKGEESPGDSFYPALLEMAIHCNTKIIILEVSDLQQALRVLEIVRYMGSWNTYEIWRDWPAQVPAIGAISHISIAGESIIIRGEGEGRAVICWR